MGALPPADITMMPSRCEAQPGHAMDRGVACSVTSESQKLLGKLERKDKRRATAKGARASQGAEIDWLLTHGLEALLKAEDSKGGARGGVLHIGGLDFALADEGSAVRKAGALPKGTVRRHTPLAASELSRLPCSSWIVMSKG